MWVGGGIGYETCAGRKYTPLYRKGIKKGQNKSMETTISTTQLSYIFLDRIDQITENRQPDATNIKK